MKDERQLIAGRQRSWVRNLALASACVMMASGCATTDFGGSTFQNEPVAGPDSPPDVIPPPVIETPEEALRRAAELTSDQSDQTVRHNPVPCACPVFEVLLGERWVRVEIDGLDDVDTEASRLLMLARQDEAKGVVRRYTVRGDLATSPRRCGPGALYLRFSLDSL